MAAVELEELFEAGAAAGADTFCCAAGSAIVEASDLTIFNSSGKVVLCKKYYVVVKPKDSRKPYLATSFGSFGALNFKISTLSY